MASVPSHVSPLKLTQHANVVPAQGCPPAALADPSWLGTPVEPSPAGTRRFLTDLSLPVRDRSPLVLFKKAAYVDVGVVRGTPDGCEVEISWQSSSLAPLFPVFAGRLVLAGSDITLEGFYAPPGGQVGAALDRAFLNIAARGTARWFLEQVAAALAENPEFETAPVETPRMDHARSNHPAGKPSRPGGAGTIQERSLP